MKPIKFSLVFLVFLAYALLTLVTIPGYAFEGTERARPFDLLLRDVESALAPDSVGPSIVTFIGPSNVTVGSAVIFQAYVEPLSTTLPLTYVWEATDFAPVTRTGVISDSYSWTWNSLGPKSITVTAQNAYGLAQNFATINVNPLSDVSIAKSVSADRVAAGGGLDYTITYVNASDSVLTSVVITDLLPLNTSLVSVYDGGLLVGNELQWSLGTVLSNSTGTVRFRVRVDSSASVGTVINNAAHLASDQTNVLASNQTSSQVEILPGFGLSSKTASGGASLAPGDLVTYTIVYTNSGTETAIDTRIVDELSPYLTYQTGGAYTDGVVTFDVGTVDVHTGGRVSFSAIVRGDTPGGAVITNVATIDTAQTDPIPTNEVRQTVHGPELSLHKSVAPTGTVELGALLVYEIQYQNVGDVTANNVVITDTLPAGLLHLSGGDSVDGKTLRWELGSLVPSAGGTVAFTAQVVEGAGRITNRAFGRGSNYPLISSNAVSLTVNVAGLEVGKSSVPVDEVEENGLVTYRLAYTGTGTQQATSALLLDPLSDKLAHVAGGTYVSDTHAVRFFIGNVQPGESGTLTFTARVQASAGETITNTSYVFYDEYYAANYTSLDTLVVTGTTQFSPYGGNSGREYAAQSFMATASRIDRVGILVNALSTPYPQVKVSLVADAGGAPDLNQVLFESSFQTLSGSKHYFAVSDVPHAVDVGTRYWIVAHFTTGGSGSAGVLYVSDAYTAGQWLYSLDGVSWNVHPGVENADLDVRVDYSEPPRSNTLRHAVVQAPKCMEVIPSQLSFYIVKDVGTPQTKKLVINNCASGTVNWTATKTAAWLDISSTSGTAPSTLWVTATGATFDFGIYETTIRIDGGDAANSPQVIDVRLKVGDGKLYLPLVIRNWPPRPQQPTLNAIDNGPEMRGTYTVTWQFAEHSTTYLLEEATKSDFSDATTLYSGSDLTHTITSPRKPTLYYYRVRGENEVGTGPWSNVVSVDVRWETLNNDTAETSDGPIFFDRDYFGMPEDTYDWFVLELDGGHFSVQIDNYQADDGWLVVYPGPNPSSSNWCDYFRIGLSYGGEQATLETSKNLEGACNGQAGNYYVRVYTNPDSHTTIPYTLRLSRP